MKLFLFFGLFVILASSATAIVCTRDPDLTPLQGSVATNANLSIGQASTAPRYNQSAGGYYAGPEYNLSTRGVFSDNTLSSQTLNFSHTTNFTMMIDFKLESCVGTNNTGLMAKVFRMAIYLDPQCDLYVGLRNSTYASDNAVGGVYGVGTTRTVAFLVYNASNRNLTLYVNGTMRDSKITTVTNFGEDSGSDRAFEICAGRAIGGGNVASLNGTCYQAAIWNYTVSPEEMIDATNTRVNRALMPMNGLVAWWEFQNSTPCYNDDGSMIRNVAHYTAPLYCTNIPTYNQSSDSSGNGRNIRSFGAGALYNSVSENINLTGAITSSNTSQVFNCSNFTLAARYTPSVMVSAATILHNDYTTTAGLQRGWQLRHGAGTPTDVLFCMSNYTNTDCTIQVDPGTMVVGTTYDLAVTYNSSSGANRGFNNGTFIASATRPNINVTGLDPMLIASTGNTNGTLDDVYLWCRTLSDTEVGYHYNSRNVTDGLWAKWVFSTTGPTCRAYP